MKHFNFGKNWMKFSVTSLNQEKIHEAEESLKELIGEENIKDKTFLDIGSGSGIFALGAKSLGAKKVVGIDVSKESVETALMNKREFAPTADIVFVEGSILDKRIQAIGCFDIVYSWGVLHHTGKMWEAIENAMKLVENKGIFVIAIYQKHWSSKAWLLIKKIYNGSPPFFQKIMAWLFYGVLLIAKIIVTRKNPFKKRRGMSFYYDVIDWLGGYPYEYASKQEICTFFEKNNFALVKYTKPPTPTGCLEFVFKKI